MNPIRDILHLVRNSALVTVAVILGFGVGSALGLPVWLQSFFLIPAMILFYALSNEKRPAFWKTFGFAGLLSVFVLLFSLSFKYVPVRYIWVYILIALAPFGPILNWFERRFTPTKDKSEQDAPSDGDTHQV